MGKPKRGASPPLKGDVDTTAPSPRGVLTFAKNAAVIVGLFGGAVALTNGTFQVYERMRPSDLIVEWGHEKIAFSLDSSGTRLKVDTPMRFENRGKEQVAVSAVYATIWSASKRDSSTIHLNSTRLDAPRGDQNALPTLPAATDEIYTISLAGGFSDAEASVLSTGALQIEIALMLSKGKERERLVTNCFHFGPLAAVELKETGRFVAQASDPSTCRGA